MRAMDVAEHAWLRRLAGPPMRRLLGSLIRVETAEPVAALTFDDGPDPATTPRVLEILERHGARGTFFLLGEHAVRQPALLRRMAAAGHALANHSWDHPAFPWIAGRERRRQIRRCAAAIAPHGVRLFRPPYGEQSLGSRLDAWRLGYEVVMFSCEVGDWCSADGRAMGAALVRRVRPGDIVCLHDALRWHGSDELMPTLTAVPHVDREAMLEAVNFLLETAGHRLRFVTVPALMRLGAPVRANYYRVTPPQSRARAAQPTPASRQMTGTSGLKSA